MEAVFQAEQELAIRKSRALANQSEQRQALDDCDIKIEQCRRSIALPVDGGVVLQDCQRSSIAVQLARGKALADASREAASKDTTDPAQLKTMLEALSGVINDIGRSCPTGIPYGNSRHHTGSTGSRRQTGSTSTRQPRLA